MWTVVLKKIRPNVLCNIPQFPPHTFLKTMSLSKKKRQCHFQVEMIIIFVHMSHSKQSNQDNQQNFPRTSVQRGCTRLH